MKKINGRRWVQQRRWLARRRKKTRHLWDMIGLLEQHCKLSACLLKVIDKKE